MPSEIESGSVAVEYARRLQRRLCTYGTEHGDGKRCDCKFIADEQVSLKKGKRPYAGEQTGCCEARSLIEWLELDKDETVTVIKNADNTITISLEDFLKLRDELDSLRAQKREFMAAVDGLAHSLQEYLTATKGKVK